MSATPTGFGTPQPHPPGLTNIRIIGELDAHPWDDQEFLDEEGVFPGCRTIWGTEDGDLAFFHTTTRAAAQSIFEHGPAPSKAVRVGWGDRTMPPGFWVSVRPTVPWDSDIWMPDVCGEDWVILMIRAKPTALKRYVFEHTWKVPQFCLQSGDIASIFLLPPHVYPQLLHPETAGKISSYRAEYHGESEYLDALDAAVALAESGALAAEVG